jgi:anti-anti-sigma regulatory factor
MRIKGSKSGKTLTVDLSGDLDESTDKAFAKLAVGPGIQTVTLNMAGLGKINSIGVRHFIGVLDRVASKSELLLINCSTTYVDYCNLLAKTLHAELVESFEIPYACESCRFESRPMFERAMLQDGAKTQAMACLKCGGEAKPSVDLDRYLEFLHL